MMLVGVSGGGTPRTHTCAIAQLCVRGVKDEGLGMLGRRGCERHDY